MRAKVPTNELQIVATAREKKMITELFHGLALARIMIQGATHWTAAVILTESDKVALQWSQTGWIVFCARTLC